MKRKPSFQHLRRAVVAFAAVAAICLAAPNVEAQSCGYGGGYGGGYNGYYGGGRRVSVSVGYGGGYYGGGYGHSVYRPRHHAYARPYPNYGHGGHRVIRHHARHHGYYGHRVRHHGGHWGH